jgi:hypothetical protein
VKSFNQTVHANYHPPMGFFNHLELIGI